MVAPQAEKPGKGRKGGKEAKRTMPIVWDALHHNLLHSLWFLPVLFVFLFILPDSVQSQQSASLHVPVYATDRRLSLRQNICDRAKKYDNELTDDLDIRYALEGLQLNVAGVNGIYFLYENGALNEEYPGLMPVLMDEIAKRGRFTWRDSFAVYDEPTGNHTWTEMLLFMTNYYDLSLDWWVETLPRLKLGLAFPEGWYDASYILVTAKKGEEGETEVNLWGWLLPFEADVWILIVFTLVWSGVVYMFLEYLAFPRQYTGRRATESFGNDIFFSFLLFTQHFQFSPKTPASRILATSMAFWALLISSAYTANLANFFVNENNRNYAVTSMEDAIRLARPVCIHDTSASALYVQKAYPTASYVKVKKEKDLYIYVNDGLCDVAVTATTSFQDYSRTKETNGDCRLHWTGNVLKPTRAGFAAKADAGRKCTSLIHDVVNLHVLEMHADGFLGRAWEEHFAHRQDHFCDGSTQDNKHQSQRRSIQEMGGTFVVHFTISCLAIALAVFTKLWKVYKKRKNLSIVTTSVTQSGDLEKEGLDVLGPLPNGDSGAVPKADLDSSGSTPANSGSTTAPARTLLQDFWEETPSMRMKGSMYLAPRREASIGSGMGNLQLLELLQGEFQRQQDQLELKWQHQQHQSEQRVQDQLATVMERKMLLQEQRMRDQLANMMDLLRQTSNESLKGGHGKLSDKPMPTSAPEGKTSRVEVKPGTANRGRGHRAQQIQQLLYPHERQELRGATAEYFKDEDCAGLIRGKSIEEDRPDVDQDIRVSGMGLS